MKKLLNILLFGSTNFKEFPAVSINDNLIDESVLLEIGENQSDVSDTHWLLSLEPMVFGIWFENETNFEPVNGKLYFRSKENQIRAIVDLNFIESISEKEGTLLLAQVENTEVLHSSLFKLKLIYNLHYKRPNVSFNQFKNLLAAFSYPRKVRLVSFRNEDYFNIFPMDLVGEIPNTKRFAFGLRHSNGALSKILEAKKIVAAGFPSKFKDDVYELGKHHSGNPPTIDALPFKVNETNLHQFPIPEWVTKYNEIEIVKTIDLGSHMLLWGETGQAVEVNGNNDNLYHIHFLMKKNSSYVLA